LPWEWEACVAAIILPEKAMKKILSALLLASLLPLGTAQAQVTLPSGGYFQDFNTLSSGLPTGWTTRTTSTTNSIGVALNFSNTSASNSANTWSNTTGAFKNLASATGLSNTSDAAAQIASTNRCLGIRPTGSFGDPGASFALQISDTVGKTNFALNFKMEMLSVQTRTNIWSVQYGLGASPTNFVTLTNYTTPDSFGQTSISIPSSALSAIADQNQTVWFRVATLTGSTGSGSRDTVAVDDFQLTYDVASGIPVVTNLSPSSAKVGDAITLIGSSLSGVTSVSFNGVLQSTLTASESQVTTTVPVGATTGPVSVISGGTTYVGPNLTILAPIISSLTPDSGIAGDAVSISGSHLSPLTSVTFSGSGGPISVTPSASSDTSIAVLVPAGAITGPVTVTTPSGSGSANFRVIAPIAVPYGPESFTNGFGQWFTVNSAGTANWNIVTNAFGGGTTTNGTTNSWAQINGFGSDVPANDWLVVGPVNFSTSSNPVATFDTLTRFSGGTNFNELTFKVSTNYSGVGSPATNGSWASVAFNKPTNDLNVTPSGFVFMPELAGRSNVWFAFHYVAAGTAANATALWQVDNIVFSNSTLVPLGLTLPGTINEGASNVAASVFAAGTNLSAPVVVTLSNSSPADLKFKADTNSVASSTLSVTIPAGTNPVTFYLDAPKDYTPDTNKTVTVTATTTNAAFQAGSANIIVNNVDYPSTDIGLSGYTQSFSAFTNSTTLPAGWTLVAANQTFSAWGSADTGAKFSAGSTNVFGYQHTSSTATVQQVLTLKNTTGAAINALTITYNGRVARDSEGRSPAYVVYVDGQEVPALAYSTSYGDNFITRTSIQGLNIADQTSFTIVWASDRGAGSGSSKQIGLSDVSVQLGFTPFPPSLVGTTVFPEFVFDTTAEVASAVSGDGGSPVTASGFVYALSSVTNSPVIGGEGVTQVPWDFPGVGGFGVQLAPLTPLTSYVVRAYAINGIGTTYSPPVTFTTTAPNPEFAGLYTQNFNGFTNATSFPAGWKGFSSSNVNIYAGEWLSGSSTGGFYGTTNEPGVLGYQHTASTGTLLNTLTLKNLTGSTITNLFISYLGMVTQTQQVRFPSWAVFGDDGTGAVEIADLAYSTSSGTNETKMGQWTNLSVAPGATFTLTWSSGRGDNTNTGGSRRIGIGFVQIATSLQAIVTNAPVVTSSNSLTTTVGEPVNYQIAASGGATGFWATNLPGGLSLNKATGLISGAVTNTNVSGSTIGLVAYNAYGAGEIPLALTVGKGTPTVLSLPTASSITNGQALSNSILSGGTASVPGIFDWSFPATIPPLGISSQQVGFSPTDTANYNPVTVSVSVNVTGGDSAYDTWAGSYGLDPATDGAPTADPDGDSFTNAQEYAFGTSPIVANGVLLTTTASGGNLVVTWLERSDVTYNVQSTSNLAGSAFANDGTVSVVNGPAEPTPPTGYTRKQITVPATGSNFYRVAATVP
jgi:hypothetical protein